MQVEDTFPVQVHAHVLLLCSSTFGNWPHVPLLKYAFIYVQSHLCMIAIRQRLES
jgi:hypothetical protein